MGPRRDGGSRARYSRQRQPQPRLDQRRMGDEMSFRRLHLTAVLTAASLATAASPALAHHVMGGRTPSTFMEGLLSGLGHPVIGPDHLAFLLAVGIVIGVGGLNLGLAAVFVVATAIGVAIHVAGVGLPLAEIMVALSVLLAGILIVRGRALPAVAWATLFAVAGLLHGYAFGESIYGAETSPLDAYLLGLVVIQTALIALVAVVVRRMAASLAEPMPRLLGAVIIGVGFTVLIGQLIPGA
jgi:urease accessory protein